ncbi:MAG: hypothetical protein KAU14_01870 [Thermoplasmata archaeon]|nr:hypothetical protein [Thermoplasmata archaeon]
MHYKTVNIKPSTYQKLLRYKSMGSSFDDVINDILNEVDPIEMYAQALEEHHKRLEAMESGKYVTLNELKKRLRVQ